MNWRMIGIGLAILAVVIFGFSLAEPLSGSEVSANTQLDIPETDISGFTRAIEPWDWQFPRDHGAHPDFQTEWWYYTGNVATDDGRRFGYQFTIFRRAISPDTIESESEWRTDQLHMAHVTISDITNETFYHDVRYSRASAGLAGATVAPVYRVWLEDWQVIAENDDATQQRITVNTPVFGLDVGLEQVKSPALQGDMGLSKKSAGEGNASYYYSLSRLVTDGTLTIGDETFDVSGNTWMDHEFSTQALGPDTQGWDWFGLIFDNDTELMIGQIRTVDEGLNPAFGGLLIYPDGTTRYLSSEDFTITETDTWDSPHTGATYPAGWDIEIMGDDGFTFSVTPLQADQELHGTGIEYWEGAVRIEGDVTGYGYAELTGYIGTMQNRF
jgi:predicted secreted hydrolase